MPFTYVIPDLHGRSDLLDEAMVRIAAHAAGQGGTVILLGDYVAKGPDSRGVIERLLFNPLDGFTFIALKGNHDAMMVAALRDSAEMKSWLQRGGGSALASYGNNPAAVPDAHVAWLDARPLLHLDRHRLYVHAGVDPDATLEAQTEKTLLWRRYTASEVAGFGGLHVVHGHDSAPEGPLLFRGRSNLDACAWRTGRLVIGIFDDDMPGGPLDFITVQGPALSPS